MTKFLHAIFKCLYVSILLISLIFLLAVIKLPIMYYCLSSKYSVLPGNFVKSSRLNKNSVRSLSMTSIFQQPRIHLKIMTLSRKFAGI